MTDKPTIPAPIEGRVMPPEEQLPAPVARPHFTEREPAPLPPRPPGPGDIPPWRRRASAPRPAPAPEPEPETPPAPPTFPDGPPPPVTHVHVHVTPDQVAGLFVPIEPAGPTWWERVRGWVRPWHSMIAAGLALLPIPGVGYSATAVWGSALHYLRLVAGVPWAYTAALAALTLAVLAENRTGDGGPWLRIVIVRWSLIVVTIGGTAVLHWWDPVRAWTGVAW